MSNQVTATARMSAICREMLRERLNLPLDASVLLGRFSVVTEMNQVGLSGLQQLVSDQAGSSALETLAPVAVSRARGLLAGAGDSGLSQRELAASVQSCLADALAVAGTRVATETRDITAEIFAAAGADLGYLVSVCRGGTATGLELRQGHEVMLVRIDDGGAVESDHAGLTDATCADRQLELEQEVARRGVTLVNRQQQFHGDHRGGSMILSAAARRDPSLARAVVAIAGQPTSRVPAKRTSPTRPEPERRTSRTPRGGGG